MPLGASRRNRHPRTADGYAATDRRTGSDGQSWRLRLIRS